jgi:hypothetical protein
VGRGWGVGAGGVDTQQPAWATTALTHSTGDFQRLGGCVIVKASGRASPAPVAGAATGSRAGRCIEEQFWASNIDGKAEIAGRAAGVSGHPALNKETIC